MGYGPVVYIVAVVLGRRCPTYVDDMSALLRGPREVAAGQLLLLAASRAAGLHVEGHTCASLHAPRSAACWLRALAEVLPLVVKEDAEGLEITGLPPCVVAQLAVGLAGPIALAGATVRRGPCRCGLKTAVVPARGAEAWVGLLAETPFGGAAVHDCWPYLGACVAVVDDGPDGEAAQEGAALLVAEGTWAKPTAKAEGRAARLGLHHGSAGRRARHWNTYRAPLALYPAQVCLPSAATLRRWQAAFGLPYIMATGPRCGRFPPWGPSSASWVAHDARRRQRRPRG